MNKLNIGWLKEEISRLPLPMQVIFIDAILKHGGLSADKDGSLTAIRESLFDYAESGDSTILPLAVARFWNEPDETLELAFAELDTDAFARELETAHVEILKRHGFHLS